MVSSDLFDWLHTARGDVFPSREKWGFLETYQGEAKASAEWDPSGQQSGAVGPGSPPVSACLERLRRAGQVSECVQGCGCVGSGLLLCRPCSRD